METRTALIFILSVFSSILILIILIVFIYRLLRLYNRKRIEYLNNIQILQLEKEKEVLNTRIKVQEETFDLVGREIHDNINQLLTLSKLNLNSIVFNNITDVKIKTENSLKFISEAIQGLTNISKSLNTDLVKDIGITRILEQEISRINQMKSAQIKFEYDEKVNDIPPEVQLILFRISQESIRNAIIHGESKSIHIKLIISNSKIVLSIVDDGIGFDPQILIDKKLSQGIKNIEKRIKLIDGHFQLESKTGSGTALNISIPIILEN